MRGDLEAKQHRHQWVALLFLSATNTRALCLYFEQSLDVFRVELTNSAECEPISKFRFRKQAE